MQTFNPGDRVICQDAGYTDLVRGREYVVTKWEPEFYRDPSVILEGMGSQPYLAHRFRLVEDAPAKVWDDGVFVSVRCPETPELPLAAANLGEALRKASDRADTAVARSAVAASKAPDGNPKTIMGMAKPALSLIPGSAKVHLAMAFRDGAEKYGPANWRVDPVSASVYLNACERHLASWQDGEDNAADSGVHHLAHAAACLLIILDAEASGSLNDDRPPAGNTAALIKQLTKALT